jgi:hypothetical protein
MDGGANSLDFRGLARYVVTGGDYMTVKAAADLYTIALNHRSRADLHMLEVAYDLDFILYRPFR